MTSLNLTALAEELALPEAVLGPLAQAAEPLPEGFPYERLASPETAEGAWRDITARLPAWEEDGGMAQLAAALAGACCTRRAYRERNIPDEIFLNTMGCFRRFLMETHEMSGRWAFDRGFWTWRQTGCLLFRLGTLEFEYCGPMRGEHRPKELAEAPVVNVHIPSDAVLTREELDRSYDRAERFFAEEGHALCHQGPPRAVLCGTWLLAPALAELLPEGSGIRCFAGDYRLYAVEEDAPDFYRWLFGSEEPLPVEALPERTSLQRRAKARLAAGGKIGAACGILTR